MHIYIISYYNKKYIAKKNWPSRLVTLRNNCVSSDRGMGWSQKSDKDIQYEVLFSNSAESLC